MIFQHGDFAWFSLFRFVAVNFYKLAAVFSASVLATEPTAQISVMLISSTIMALLVAKFKPHKEDFKQHLDSIQASNVSDPTENKGGTKQEKKGCRQCCSRFFHYFCWICCCPCYGCTKCWRFLCCTMNCTKRWRHGFSNNTAEVLLYINQALFMIVALLVDQEVIESPTVIYQDDEYDGTVEYPFPLHLFFILYISGVYLALYQFWAKAKKSPTPKSSAKMVLEP